MSTSAAISALITVANTVNSSLAPNASELCGAAIALFLLVFALSGLGVFMLEIKRFIDKKH